MPSGIVPDILPEVAISARLLFRRVDYQRIMRFGGPFGNGDYQGMSIDLILRIFVSSISGPTGSILKFSKIGPQQQPTPLEQHPSTLAQHPNTLEQHPSTLAQHPATLQRH